MSKPIITIRITSREERTAEAKAVFDSGSFHTILRDDKVPEGALVVLRSKPQEFKTAAKGGKLLVTGDIPLMITIGDRMVDDLVLISPDLSQVMIIGAGTMQKWDISIENRNGATNIVVGRDMRDPDITEID